MFADNYAGELRHVLPVLVVVAGACFNKAGFVGDIIVHSWLRSLFIVLKSAVSRLLETYLQIVRSNIEDILCIRKIFAEILLAG